MKKSIMVVISMLCLMLLSMVTLASDKEIFSRIIILGDSLSDFGKMYDKSLGDIPASYPPNQPSVPLYYEGRFSNGPVWGDYLKDDYQMSDSQIVNEAEGGATLYNYMSKSLNPAYWIINTLNHEIYQLLNKIEQNKVEPITKNDVVIIWIGGNDLLTFGWTKDRDIYDDMSKLYVGVDALVAAGVKHFIILNLPELVVTPKGKILNDKKRNNLTIATAQFNEQLSLAIKAMGAFYVAQGVSVKPYDIHEVFNDALNYPEHYGFTDTQHACYSGSNNIMTDAQQLASVEKLSKHWNIPNDKLAEFLATNPVFSDSMQWISEEDSINYNQFLLKDFNPSACKGYVFFDSIHPTTEVHRVVADKLKAYLDANWQYRNV